MKSFDLETIDEIRKSAYRPQVVACFIYNKKLLFVYKKKYNLWQLAQGAIDNEETIEDAVVREMTEELGGDFVNASDMENIQVVGDDEITFPEETQGSRELKTDAGEKVFMLGKRYLFIAIPTENDALNIHDTEFNDSKWLDYDESLELASHIYQKGKKRITLKIIESLRALDLI